MWEKKRVVKLIEGDAKRGNVCMEQAVGQHVHLVVESAHCGFGERLYERTEWARAGGPALQLKKMTAQFPARVAGAVLMGRKPTARVWCVTLVSLTRSLYAIFRLSEAKIDRK